MKTRRSHEVKEQKNVWRDRLRSPQKNLSYNSSSPRSKSSKSASPTHKTPPKPLKRTPKRLNDEEKGKSTKISCSPKELKRNYGSSSKETKPKGTNSNSPSKPWRTKKVLDDDSQDTLTEVCRIKNEPVKRRYSLIEEENTRSYLKRSADDEDTQFECSDNKRVRRNSDQRRWENFAIGKISIGKFWSF